MKTTHSKEAIKMAEIIKRRYRMFRDVPTLMVCYAVEQTAMSILEKKIEEDEEQAERSA